MHKITLEGIQILYVPRGYSVEKASTSHTTKLESCYELGCLKHVIINDKQQALLIGKCLQIDFIYKQQPTDLIGSSTPKDQEFKRKTVK